MCDFILVSNRHANSKLALGFRSDLVADMKGKRTGLTRQSTKVSYTVPNILAAWRLFRPELRL